MKNRRYMQRRAARLETPLGPAFLEVQSYTRHTLVYTTNKTSALVEKYALSPAMLHMLGMLAGGWHVVENMNTMRALIRRGLYRETVTPEGDEVYQETARGREVIRSLFVVWDLGQGGDT